MTATPFTLDRTDSRVDQLRPAPLVRPGRRVGRSTGPLARPSRPLRAPRAAGHRGVHGCSPALVAAPSASTWRLTERGIAVVLVTGLMIMVAALVVVGLTALRVTSDGYLAPGQSALTLR